MNFNQPKAAAGVSKDTRMSTAKEMLEPCPFCGKPPKYDRHRNSFHEIRCPQLGCVIAEVVEDSFQEAAKRWNTRALPSSDQCVPDANAGAVRALEILRGRPLGDCCFGRECIRAGTDDKDDTCIVHDAIATLSAPLSDARAGAIEECAKVCDRWIASKNLHEHLAATDIARAIRALTKTESQDIVAREISEP